MSGLASLAGYDSDSDTDQDVPFDSSNVASTSSSAKAAADATKPSSSKLGSLLPTPNSGLSSMLPPPSSFSYSHTAKAKSRDSCLSLPPPSATTKRKIIRIDSTHLTIGSQDGQNSDEEARRESEVKKSKIAPSLSSSKHSLFGMLPAPKRKDGEVLAERKREAELRKIAKALDETDAQRLCEVPLSISDHASEEQEADEAETVEADAPIVKTNGKNNDAFRAMLGLKPAAKKQPTHAVASSSTSQAELPEPSPLITAKSIARESIDPIPKSTSTWAESTPTDFFSLGSTCPNTGTSSYKSSMQISAAPVIDLAETQHSTDQSHTQDDVAEYPGWQLDPDGSWVPVTPQAQAQFAAYQYSLSHPSAASTNPSSRSESNLDGTRDLLAAGLTPDDIAAFDASSAAREAYVQNGEDEDSDKYAAAAEFAAGNRELQQRKPGMLKGLRKGQLSSLVSLANENRKKLEQRWQRGRDAQAQKAKRYGW
ncbi:uncharacterized protein MEPE_05702 [Melanopsichium pennsylvanicum]|uniref:Proline-rich protein PRCC n=2 Tax=Melanopsichium pennsylvanicum TaxID=63383 RepID=A0AAJ4XTN4_9BASI|nr:putative protein [Melanopsichium pennsylvanicum 4]SNX86993.1 uncharacterized protein MEPE_05702 [Melanopsichium pennsylvanicum]